MAIWKITCPDCNHCEEVRIDIDDFSEKEQKEFLNKNKQKEIILRIPSAIAGGRLVGEFFKLTSGAVQQVI